jgi:hypothetical protein
MSQPATDAVQLKMSGTSFFHSFHSLPTSERMLSQ